MVCQEVSSSCRHGAMILEVDLHTIKLWTAVSFVVGKGISIKVDSVDLVIITARYDARATWGGRGPIK